MGSCPGYRSSGLRAVTGLGSPMGLYACLRFALSEARRARSAAEGRPQRRFESSCNNGFWGGGLLPLCIFGESSHSCRADRRSSVCIPPVGEESVGRNPYPGSAGSDRGRNPDSGSQGNRGPCSKSRRDRRSRPPRRCTAGCSAPAYRRPPEAHRGGERDSSQKFGYGGDLLS